MFLSVFFLTEALFRNALLIKICYPTDLASVFQTLRFEKLLHHRFAAF